LRIRPQLFVNRIVSAGFSNRLADEDARMVSGMCRQLGGIALAIELAAGRVATYGIRDTASLLNGQFALLWSGRRTAPPRQQTLNATLDWSYNLLSDDERKVFRQLSVFTGGFALDAACRVVTGDEPGRLDVHGIVASLVAKSLASADPGASKRYRLLDMTRTYAESKLQRAGESLDLRRRHAIYFRDLLAQAASENQDPRALAAEIDNIRAALSWSFKPSGDSELGVQLAALSATAWLGLGLLTECHDWMKTASKRLDDTPVPLPQQLGICMALASTLLFTASDISEFKPVWNKAFDLAVSLGDIESQMSCHLALWALQVRVPRYADCLAVAEDCLRTAERSDNPGAIGQAEWMLGQSKLHLGRLDEAMSHYRRFLAVDTEASRLAMMKQTGYDRRSDALGNLSCALWLTGSPEQALRIGSEAVSVARLLEFPLPIAVAGMWNGLTRYFIEPDIDKIEADMVNLVEHARTHGIVQFQGLGCRCWVFARRDAANSMRRAGSSKKACDCRTHRTSAYSIQSSGANLQRLPQISAGQRTPNRFFCRTTETTSTIPNIGGRPKSSGSRVWWPKRPGGRIMVLIFVGVLRRSHAVRERFPLSCVPRQRWAKCARRIRRRRWNCWTPSMAGSWRVSMSPIS
jgi:tetratricopeptide (TPR) repeat protein